MSATMSATSLEKFIDEHYDRSQTMSTVNCEVGSVSVLKSVSNQNTTDTVFYTPQQANDVSKDSKGKQRKKRKLKFSQDSDVAVSMFGGSSNDDDDDGDDDDDAPTDDQNFDPGLPDLTQIDSGNKAAILGVLSAWLGEMNYQMQQTFTARFEEAIEKVRREVKHDIIEYVVEYVETDEAKNALASQREQIHEILAENETLQSRCRILEGRLTRAEREVEELKEEQLMQQARSMRDNVKFFNVPEAAGDDENCRETILKFLKDEMKMRQADVDKVKFERIHRVGKRARNQTRTMVGKVNPEGKQLIFRHVKNLDKDKKFGVSDQLPRELEERKKRLLPAYKDAKKDSKDVKWSVDKLIVDGKVQSVKKDQISDVNVIVSEKAIKMHDHIRHSSMHVHMEHSFQAHTVQLHGQDDIVPSLHAIYSDERVARAAHNVYAYRLKTASGYREHFMDDGEWGAGAKLLALLREHNIEDTLVCTTRWKGPKNLGKARYDHILKTAKEVLRL